MTDPTAGSPEPEVGEGGGLGTIPTPPGVVDPVEAMAWWATHPIEWIETFIGDGELWGGQREIAEALVWNREVNAVTGHSVGKDWLAGRLVIWWLMTRPDSIVLTTAAKEQQVVSVLWGEVRQAAKRARVPLGGRLAPVAPEWRLGPKHYALGMVARDTNAAQGFHSDSVLVIVDEAAGVPEEIQVALEGCASTGGSRILRIGNPTCGPTEAFARYCSLSDVRGVRKTIRIPSTRTPNYVLGREVVPGLASREYVEGVRSKYGEGSAVYKARVLAQFPTASSDSLIGYEHLSRSRARFAAGVEPAPETPRRLGVDVARFGDDSTRIWIGQGPKVFRPTGGVLHRADGTTVALRAIEIAKEWGAVSIAVDTGGVGASVVDVLYAEQEAGRLPPDVEILVNDFGAKATDPAEWADRRTELWWRLRDWLRDEAAFDPDDGVEEELLAPTYRFTGRSKRLEPKERIKARIGRSPDDADAIALAVGGHVGRTSSVPRLSVW